MARSEGFGRMCGFIDQDTEFDGTLRFKESFRIDGKFTGKILKGENLIVGESGEVNADVEVRNVSINGRVNGNVTAKDRAEIFANGRVSGKMVTPKLIIEEGAFFQGTCQMELKVLESQNRSAEKKTEKK